MSTATASSTAPQPPPPLPLSASSPRQTGSSPPTSLSSPSTTTNQAQPIHAHAPLQLQLQPDLPSEETQRHIDEARAAVVASMGNMLDSELQSRATILHENAAALDKQEKDVLRATEGLRREREKLAKEADAAARKVKELGNVQNWAEVLERGFLVLEETVRLANGGRDARRGGGDDDDGHDDDDGGRSSRSCSCSDCGSRSASVSGDDDRMVHLGDNGQRILMSFNDDDNGKDNDSRSDKGSAKGKKPDDYDVDMMMDVDGGVRTAWSDASRSLMEPESSTGTGMAKGSETASLSTNP